MVAFSLLVASLSSSCTVPMPEPVFRDLLLQPTIPTLAQVAEECFGQQVLDLTNQERAKLGLAPLRFSPQLSEASQWMAADMANHNYFDHLDQQGRRVDARAYAFGYRGLRCIGENIAAGQESPADVVAQWMSSPGHRRNMLRPEFTEMGVGFAKNPESTYGQYWVQTLAHRPNYVTSR